jgi:large subunit ribosomal protein L25
MAEDTPLRAEVRERAGKGAARATRRAGRVPAIIYGDRQDPMMISLNPIELTKQLHSHGFFSHIFAIETNGEKHRVLARDVQYHPVTDRPLHVDFLRFGANTVLNVDVEVSFENEEECPGLRRGGVLNIVRHTVELVCKADKIPERLFVDLSGLEVGDSVHISHIKLPDGVRPAITDRDFTVATIAAPIVATAEEEAEDTASAADREAAVAKSDGEDKHKKGEE